MGKLEDTHDSQAVANMASASAGDVKKLGWRKIVDRARANAGRLKVTNHAQAQAVVMTVEAYEALLAEGRRRRPPEEEALAALRTRFDEQLARLESPAAAAGLREAIDAGKLHGKVKAGQSC